MRRRECPGAGIAFPPAQRFERRFTAERMARDYLSIYRSLMADGATERRQLQDNQPLLSASPDPLGSVLERPWRGFQDLARGS
jgi:hypothetical protein